MFRAHLVRIVVIGSLAVSCGCLCSGNRPLLDRLRHHDQVEEGCPCGEVSAFPQEGPTLQDYGPYPASTTYPGGTGGCPTLVPQGTPLPPLGSAPGVRIEPRPAPTEPYRP
jgi:hypothetical protein